MSVAERLLGAGPPTAARERPDAASTAGSPAGSLHAPGNVAAVPNPESVVVVGASLAGLRASEALRRLGFDGRVTMVGAETHLPYDRPPLSKAVLAGDADAADVGLRRAPYEDLDLDLRLGRRAVGLDVESRTITLDDGEQVSGTTGVVLATGATPRRIPGLEPGSGVHELRTIDDCLALRGDLDAGPGRVVVIGAGFIGAEVAATCRGRGLEVSLLEALPVPMVRGLGPRLGGVLAELHRDHGVDLRTGIGVESIDRGTRVERVRLADGATIDADVVLVGVGVQPRTDWLASSGLTLDNGVVCDESLLAAPGIVAAGDVCRWPNLRFGRAPTRLEHWTNAAEQGAAAAARLLATDDEAVAFDPVPFVWSDQYDVKIQVVGDVQADDELEVVEGSLEERVFVAAAGRDGRVVGAVAFSRPRLLMQMRRLIVEGSSFADAVAFGRGQS